MADLGTLGGAQSFANAINGHGHVVGEADLRTGRHAFAWKNGTTQDLNKLISGSAWLLDQAYDISDGGRIAGSGVINGQRRAYLLVPTQ